MSIRAAVIRLLMGVLVFSCPLYGELEHWFDFDHCSTDVRRLGLTHQRIDGLLDSFNHRISSSDKTRRMQLSARFAREMLRRILSTDVWRTNETFFKKMVEHTLNDTGHGDIAQDNGRRITVYQVVFKWAQQEVLPLRPIHDEVLWDRRQKGALTAKVLDFNELMLWCRGKGPYASNAAVAAYIPLNLFNRTQPTVSWTMRGTDGKEVTLPEVVRAMREAEQFDPKGAPDVVPIPDPSNQVQFRFVTFAHRRLVAAREAGIEVVLVKVHRPDAYLPNKKVSDGFSVKLDVDGRFEFEDPVTGTRRREGPTFQPEKWGEAVICACVNTRIAHGYTEEEWPNTGRPGLPPFPRPPAPVRR